MDKDDNLFEDQINEDDDLLNISLDDLSTDEIEEPVKEEPDEDIIELIDLLEKGEEAFLGVADDSDSSSEEDLSSEGVNEIPDEDADADATPQSEFELDDVLIDTDMSAQGDDLESDLSDEEFEKLLTEDSMDDLDIENGESEDTVNDLENFLNEVDMENPPDNSGSSFDSTEDLNPEMENFSSLNNVLDEAGLWDDEKTDVSIDGDGDGTLFEDIDLTDYEKEEIPESGDGLIAESDDVVLKTIVSSEDNGSSEEAIWEMDKQSDTDDIELESESVEEQAAIDEDEIETSEAFLDEADDIALEVEDESLEELLSEDSLQDGAADEDPEVLQEQAIVDEDLSEASEDIFDEIDDIPLLDENESLDELFSEGGLQDEAADEEPEDSPDQTAVDEDHSEVSDGLLDEIDDIPLDGESLEELLSGDKFGDEGFTDESQSESKQELFLTDGEQMEVTDDITDTVMDDAFQDIETEESLLTEEIPISAPDASETESGISEAVNQQPIISEEKVEEMVRTVVGEVVERIAREVFSEIAEKVITKAIDSLKESLDSDSE